MKAHAGNWSSATYNPEPLARYPTGLADRERRREELLASELMQAMRRIAETYKSYSCYRGYGCETANNTCVGGRDRSGCLCECHDRPQPEVGT